MLPKNKIAREFKAHWDWVLGRSTDKIIKLTEHEAKAIIEELERLEKRAEGFRKIALLEKEKNRR